jgi:Ubiquitin-like domain
MDVRPISDVPLLISSANSSSERRVSPAWSIAHLKARLEPITGIPASAQRLRLASQAIEAADEEATQLSAFTIQPYAELQVSKLFSNCPLVRCPTANLGRESPFQPVLRLCGVLEASFDKSNGATCCPTRLAAVFATYHGLRLGQNIPKLFFCTRLCSRPTQSRDIDFWYYLHQIRAFYSLLLSPLPVWSFLFLTVKISRPLDVLKPRTNTLSYPFNR